MRRCRQLNRLFSFALVLSVYKSIFQLRTFDLVPEMKDISSSIFQWIMLIQVVQHWPLERERILYIRGKDNKQIVPYGGPNTFLKKMKLIAEFQHLIIVSFKKNHFVHVFYLYNRTKFNITYDETVQLRKKRLVSSYKIEIGEMPLVGVTVLSCVWNRDLILTRKMRAYRNETINGI